MKFALILVLIVGVSVSEATRKSWWKRNPFRKRAESLIDTASQVFKSQDEINNEMRHDIQEMVEKDPNSFKDAVEKASQNEDEAEVLLEMFSEVQTLLEEAKKNVDKGILKRSEELEKKVKENPQIKRQPEDINEEEDEFPKIILNGIKQWVDDRIEQAPLLIKARMDMLNYYINGALKDITNYYEQLDNLQDPEIKRKLAENSQGFRYHYFSTVDKVKDIRQSIAQNPCLKLNACSKRLQLE